jgi:peptidoglycan-associated lipoprotein
MIRRLVPTIALASALSLSIAACAKKAPAPAPAPPPPPPTAPAPPPPPPPPPPAPAPAAPRALTEDEIFARKSLEELSRELTDVFFDLDRADLREDSKAPLQKNADWMKRWASTSISVEGHCDARGSAEYNLALGSRRATAVKEYLVSLGVPTGRIAVLSKGKEQPFCNEETEACWQQNRRGHFVVTAK